MIINHNTSAINASRNNSINAANLSKTQEKLSSGYRINRASDDAAGMGVAGKINAQIRGLAQGSRNTSKAINFVQTTEGNLNELEGVLVRMKELAVQSGNGTYSDADRGSIQIEIEQLTDEINRIADQSQYNQMHMLSNKSSAQNVSTAEELGMQPAKINTPSSLTGAQASWTLRVHVGANQDEAIAVNIYAANVANLFAGEGNQVAQAAPAQAGAQQEGTPAAAAAPAQGGVNSPVNVTTTVDANMSLAKIENAIRMVSDQRANLGAFQNRLESIKSSTEYSIENLKASYAQIKDAAMTDEMVSSTTNSILTQSAMAMIAQANQVPQYVLSLLR
ncbi:flagellin [Candidatus Borreliella tachyglossi]|uniref:Flagellin n=5 Tax=Borreliaceae TaxID=1643685 RepID=A0A2S1LW78_9SPIR|nr:flagellin [Candidatus Borreliella tachyglossi]AWG42541.1 flagellin [Candidatus Borreliella tachyglossi]